MAGKPSESGCKKVEHSIGAVQLDTMFIGGLFQELGAYLGLPMGPGLVFPEFRFSGGRPRSTSSPTRRLKGVLGIPGAGQPRRGGPKEGQSEGRVKTSSTQAMTTTSPSVTILSPTSPA